MVKSLIEPLDISDIPYYKRLYNITIDCFDIPIKNCDFYFLSHFHSDHYTRLSAKFEHLVYCSKTTAELVATRIGSKAVGLEMYTTYNMGCFYVRLVEANHCPGAVLFIFVFGTEYYLHTGDFRFHPTFHKFEIPFKSIYLDNTYENFQNLPTQKEAVSKILKIFDQKDKLCPINICVLCCTYLVGKEKIFLSVAEYLNKKVQVTEDKMAIYKCYDKYTVNRINNDVLEIVNEQKMNKKTFGFEKNVKLKVKLETIKKKSRSRKKRNFISVLPSKIKIEELETIKDPYTNVNQTGLIYSPKSTSNCSLITAINKRDTSNYENNSNINDYLRQNSFNESSSIEFNDSSQCISSTNVSNDIHLNNSNNNENENLHIADSPNTNIYNSNYVDLHSQLNLNKMANSEITDNIVTNNYFNYNFDSISESLDFSSYSEEQEFKPFDRITTDEAPIKVISMNELNSFDFTKIFADKIYILCGTGWKESHKLKNFKRMDGKTIKNGIEIIHFRYSEHSSKHELEEFKNLNRFESIINTVNNK